ncbi:MULTISPECIES: terminase large subunit [Gemella]|uniref:terminase large subunit n=1 Tax=Gemella TaxID=1378 RepID=UPI000AD5179C|nr:MULTISPECIES: terminase TerL endonuclease subunit [Gemella]
MIDELLKIMNMATGINVVGKSIYDSLHDFQCFFLANVFGWRFKNDVKMFKHREIILFIPRKNAKTFICALCLIILMLTEADYSEFYSICIDRDLAGEVKKAITQIITASPVLAGYFKLTNTLIGKITCLINKNTYQARTSQANSNNAIRPSAFIADEIGAFKDKSNIKAMESGQLNVDNPLIFKITTAYAEDRSIMLEELEHLKKIYSGTEENERLFSLLYYADKDNLWTEKGIQMANPLRIEKNYESIRYMRDKALAIESERVEYLTKHMNHFLPTFSGEEYISVDKVKECVVLMVDFSGRDVYVGLDLALSTDNVAVSIASLDDDGETILLDSWAFIPRAKVEDKSRKEKTNYRRHIDRGNCFACGDEVIDYGFVEKFIIGLEDELNCNVMAVGYDLWNAPSTVQKLEEEGLLTVQVRQHSSVLHPTVKLVEEKILNKEIQFEDNPLFVQNFQNARVIYDNNLNKWVNKKRSTGKIDMLAAAFSAVHLLMQNEILGNTFVSAVL